MKALPILCIVALAGCATAPREPYVYTTGSTSTETLDPYAHLSPDAAAAYAEIAKANAPSAAISGKSPVSEAGVDLSAFGPVGASGIVDLCRCQNAVYAAKLPRARRLEMLQECYQLLPAEIRNAVQRADEQPSYPKPVRVR